MAEPLRHDRGSVFSRRWMILGVIVAAIGLLSACSDEPGTAATTTPATAPTTSATTIEAAATTLPATTEPTATTEPDRLALATERIRGAECWQKLNDRVNWMSDYIEFDLEGTDDGQFIEDRLDVLEGETEGCDASTAVEELAEMDHCPRIMDMVTDLEEAESVASENPDHTWTPDLEANINAERDAFAGLAADAGCDV